jgi:hypothetical protein
MTNAEINRQIQRAEKKADKHQSRDLFLCITNYEGCKMFIRNAIHNLKQKQKKGIFDEVQAVQMFYLVVFETLKNKKFNRFYTYDLQMVDVPTRYAVAVELLEYYTEEIEEG